MKVQRTWGDLTENLQRQFSYLESSAKLFDAGRTEEAARLATTVRTLIHDTAKSSSLLGQMNLKTSFTWFGQAITDRLYTSTGTVNVSIEVMYPDGTTEMLPPTNQNGLVDVVNIRGTPTHVPVFRTTPPPPTRWLTFEEWWTDPTIALSGSEAAYSRRRLVLEMANSDGGAHVDPRGVDSRYAAFSKYGVGPFWSEHLGNAGKVDGPRNRTHGNAAAISMRQIAHEVVQTLVHQGYPDFAPPD